MQLSMLMLREPRRVTGEFDLERRERLRPRDRCRLQPLLELVEERRILTAEFFDERERAAMNWRWAEPPHGVLMLLRAVALVPLKTVTGMLTREAIHEPVAMRLGDDRRRRDREVDAVPFY